MGRGQLLGFEVKESSSVLRSYLRKPQPEYVCKRLKFLRWFALGYIETQAQAAKKLAVKRQTIADWVKIYVAQGIDGLLQRGTSHQKKAHSSRLTDEMKTTLLQWLDDPKRPNTSYKSLWLEASEKFNLEMSYNRFHEILYDQMLIRLKVPRPINVQKAENAEEAFKKTRKNARRIKARGW